LRLRPDILSQTGQVRKVPILLQKSQKALPLISRQRTKQATIADQCSLKPVTGIACEFEAWWRSPPRFYSIAAPAAQRI
jgi:hypothetical protein